MRGKRVRMFDCAYLAIHYLKISNLDNKQVPLQTIIELYIAGRVGKQTSAIWKAKHLDLTALFSANLNIVVN